MDIGSFGDNWSLEGALLCELAVRGSATRRVYSFWIDESLRGKAADNGLAA